MNPKEDNHVAQPEADEISYEQAVAELEQIVAQLESGEVPLDESMKLFQRGTELARICSARLDAIEQKITQLIEQPDGSFEEVPFGHVE